MWGTLSLPWLACGVVMHGMPQHGMDREQKSHAKQGASGRSAVHGAPGCYSRPCCWNLLVRTFAGVAPTVQCQRICFACGTLPCTVVISACGNSAIRLNRYLGVRPRPEMPSNCSNPIEQTWQAVLGPTPLRKTADRPCCSSFGT
jgi:hypothetical protein